VIIFDFFVTWISIQKMIFIESLHSCRQYDILLSGTILPIIAVLPYNKNDLTKVGYGRISNCASKCFKPWIFASNRREGSPEKTCWI